MRKLRTQKRTVHKLSSTYWGQKLKQNGAEGGFGAFTDSGTMIVQNGNPPKEVIAFGQTYFAIQTYRQEVADHFNELNQERRCLVVRGDIKQWNQLLIETTHDAGVITNEEFTICFVYRRKKKNCERTRQIPLRRQHISIILLEKSAYCDRENRWNHAGGPPYARKEYAAN